MMFKTKTLGCFYGWFNLEKKMHVDLLVSEYNGTVRIEL